MKANLTDKFFSIPYRSKSLKTLLQQTPKDKLELVYLLTNHERWINTKIELINYILTHYQDILHIFFSYFTTDIWKFIELLLKKNGELTVKDSGNVEYIVLLNMYLIAFPVIKNGERTLIVPHETLDFLKKLDKTDYITNVKLNDTITTYTRALLEYYGYYEIDVLEKYLKKYEDIEFAFDKYFPILSNDSLIYGYYVEENCVYLPTIEENPTFFMTRKQINNIDYYPLTKKDIYSYTHISKEEVDLANFFIEHFEIDEDDLASTILAIKLCIQMDFSIKDILEDLDYLELSPYEMKQLEKCLVNLQNNTRLWSLKGYTKNELKVPKLIRFPKSLN